MVGCYIKLMNDDFKFMHYLFSGFVLDTDKKELYFDDKLVSLTKQNYTLLLFFTQNTNTVIDRELLMKNVWSGKVVNTNTIDQAIVKLKKILLAARQEDYFENVYGHGIKFLPKVKVVTSTKYKKSIYQSSSWPNTWLAKPVLLTAFMLLALIGYWWLQPKSSQQEIEKSLLLVLPNASANDEWLQDSSSLLAEQLLSFSNTVYLKKYQDKPKNLSQQEYLENQWKLSPDLKVITSNIALHDNVFTVGFSILNKQQELSKQDFHNQSLQVAYQQASQWLAQQLNSSVSLTPDIFNTDNPYVLELYMRGLAAVASEKSDKATHFFELCIDESPDYYLATLELAKLARRVGDQEKALALLDTITAVSNNDNLFIKAESLHAGILLRQGKLDDAKRVVTQLLVKYADNSMLNTVSAQYILTLVYKAKSQNDLAKQSANKLEKVLLEAEDYKWLSQLYVFESTLFISLGEADKAQAYARKGLELYTKLGDLTGVAKSHSVLGRITRNQAKYDEAYAHFSKALAISRSIDYKFGIGAVLNEMINLSVSQGKLNQAWKLNQEMEEIAIEIDFSALFLAAKQLSIEIAIAQKKWSIAELHLQEHYQLANASGNKRNMFYNKVLDITLKIDLNQPAKVETLIAEQQAYLDESHEESLQSWLNVQIVRYYFLINKPTKALAVLNSAMLLANKNKDSENIVQLNNLLAEYYLKLKQPKKTLTTLEKSAIFKPIAVPYLMLKSEAYFQLQQLTKAIECAHMGKRQAHELWSVANEAFLAKLIAKKRLMDQ